MPVSAQHYGNALPDQVERISTLFDCHIEVINDVRELYKDRVALEREYATKLQALTKKAAEKKAKSELEFIIGDEPTKTWDSSALKQNTLNAAYDQIIESMSKTAEDHVNIADSLSSQVADVLKAVARKNEDVKRKEMLFFQKLVSDRDRTYAERAKAKQKYDEECGEVDLYRQKQGRSHDDKHAERIARQADQQRNDMLNCKNTYIISIAVANKVKEKFYDEDLPELENQLQILQTKLVERFTKIIQHAQVLQSSHLDVLKGRSAAMDRALLEINPAQDQDIFIDYNVRPFTAPVDWKFEPCATFYDTEELNVDPAPKVLLQNKLNRSRSKLYELEPLIETKRRDVEQFTKLEEAYETEKSLGNTDDITESYMASRHELVHFGSSECILNAEINVIVSVIGDDVGAQTPHTFKSSSFSIPTTCGYCKASIWGLSKQGKTCKACGLSVHSKCELKVPANCQHGTVSRASSMVSRSKSTASRASVTPASLSRQVPTPSSFVHSTHEEEEAYPTARVIFDFGASSEFELTVKDGSIVKVMEPDDGSGWVKVADARGKDGLVPASYLDYEDTDEDEAGLTTPTPSSLSLSPKGSGEFVRVLYQYVARGSDEISVKEGDVIELSSGPTGGRHYGDGWWEGYNPDGQKGIFPSNYVEGI